MEVTRSVFNRNAQQLIRALEIDTNQQKIDEIDVETKVTSFQLFQWRVECGDDKDPNLIYLVHPPVEIVAPHAYRIRDSVQNTKLNFYEERLLEDHAISVDDQVVISKDQAGDWMDVTTQWNLSIVYSSTYCAPVLYFHVQSPSGDPCGRQDVIEMLRNLARTIKIPNETWEFVSQEEHPFGLPFLHSSSLSIFP